MHILLSSIHHLAALPETAQKESADSIAFLSLNSSNAFIASRGSNSQQCYSKVVKNACALPTLHLHRQLLNLNLTDGICCRNSSLPTTAATAFSIFLTAAPPQTSTVNQVYSRVICLAGPYLLWPLTPSCRIWADCILSLLITAYADNVIFAGPLSVLCAANDRHSEQKQAMGPACQQPRDWHESAIFVPEWQAGSDEHILARQEIRQNLFPAAQVPVMSIPMMNGTAIPIAQRLETASQSLEHQF